MKLHAGAIYILSMASCLARGFPVINERQTTQCLSADDAITLINTIFDDLNQVNNFINESPLLADTPKFKIQDAMNFENDESNQAEPLRNLCNPDDGANGQTYIGAINTVQSATSQELGALADIQQGVGTIQDNVNSVNTVRCCTILPSYDEIFSVAGLTLGITANLEGVAAPRPEVCNDITC